MGSFGGHALPGSFFFLFGLWWTIRVFGRFWSSRKNGTKFTSTLTFDAPCLCGRLKNFPIDAVLIIFFTFVGGSLEIYHGWRDGKVVSMPNAQHATMFAFFGLFGLMEILVHYKAPLPTDINYVSGVLALIVEGLLFHFHLHGRAPLDVMVHTLLVYVIAGNTISAILEMRYRHNLLAILGRLYFMCLQGTWFWQVGFILYNPFHKQNAMWDEHDHNSLLIAGFVFAWHCGIVFVGMLIVGAVISLFYRNRAHSSHSNDTSLHRLIRTGQNGHTLISMDDDEDSDIEYSKPALLSN